MPTYSKDISGQQVISESAKDVKNVSLGATPLASNRNIAAPAPQPVKIPID